MEIHAQLTELNRPVSVASIFSYESLVVAGGIRHCELDLSSHCKVEEPRDYGLRSWSRNISRAGAGVPSGPLPLSVGVN